MVPTDELDDLFKQLSCLDNKEDSRQFIGEKGYKFRCSQIQCNLPFSSIFVKAQLTAVFPFLFLIKHNVRT